MDTIHILQKTYEDLYLARIPLLDFLQERLPIISSQWKKECVERVLEKDNNLTVKQKVNQNKKRKDFTQLDIYFLIQILVDERNFRALQTMFPNDLVILNQENLNLFYRIKDIRCTVMHPTFEVFTAKDLKTWENEIVSFVNIFNPNKTLQEYRIEFHKKEKENLLTIILEKVINPALNSKNLNSEIKEHIRNTKERLEKQNTAEGVIAFYTDALDSIQGQEIAKVLEDNELLSFEKIRDELFYNYE